MYSIFSTVCKQLSINALEQKNGTQVINISYICKKLNKIYHIKESTYLEIHVLYICNNYLLHFVKKSIHFFYIF